ncbi:MAG: histidine kinase dimerization/phosphoacceptor domain -containing protein [Prochloraceae cyanobacterium]|nr:histidine kinase dimerization/phosphoacceptor domain -containing protein [Prochloraceae cyanobacterium]
MTLTTKNTIKDNRNFDFQKYTILLVDDNPTNLELVVDYLEDYGLTILVSQDGESAFNRAKYANPDLILLDVMMPGIDGFETCRLLKADPKTKDIPVIFMTALSSTEDRVKGFEVGAVDYVVKPIQQEEVFARIKLHLQLHSLTQSLEEKNKNLTQTNLLLRQEIEQRQAIEIKFKKTNQRLKQVLRERTEAQKSLQKFNEELETIIKQRTFKLIEINKRLQQEITRRQQAEVIIKKSLKEKEMLLKEIHHRVKNNLLVVSSLLEFQTDYIKDPDIISMFADSQNRIYSMALIHEQLYKSKDLAKLDFGTYLESLVYNLFESYNINHESIRCHLEIQPVNLNIETAHACGLLVNELISNAIEHGFPEQRKGNIWIGLKQNSNQKIVLNIRDDGIGFPEDLDFRETESLGMQLVCTLTEQLEGEIEMKRCQGTSFNLVFAELNYRSRF